MLGKVPDNADSLLGLQCSLQGRRPFSARAIAARHETAQDNAVVHDHPHIPNRFVCDVREQKPHGIKLQNAERVAQPPLGNNVPEESTSELQCIGWGRDHFAGKAYAFFKWVIEMPTLLCEYPKKTGMRLRRSLQPSHKKKKILKYS